MLEIGARTGKNSARMQNRSERMAGYVVCVNHNHLIHMIARSLEFRASENLRSTSTTQPSAPRMQSNSERMAGCVVAVNHNHLKQMIARSLEFGVHLREAYKPLNLRKTTLRKQSESHIMLSVCCCPCVVYVLLSVCCCLCF